MHLRTAYQDQPSHKRLSIEAIDWYMKLKYSSFLLALAGLACIFVFLLLRLQFRQLNDHTNNHPSLQISSNKPNIRTREQIKVPLETSDEHSSHTKPGEPSGAQSEAIVADIQVPANETASATSPTLDQSQISDPDSPYISNSLLEQQQEHIEQHEPDLSPPLPGISLDSIPLSPSRPSQPSSMPLASTQQLVSNAKVSLVQPFPKIYMPSSSSLSSPPLAHLFDLYTHHIQDTLVEVYSTASSSVDSFNLVENFHQALRTGVTLSDTNNIPYTYSYSNPHTYQAMVTHMKKKLSELDIHLVLEYSSLPACSTLTHELLGVGGVNATIVLVQVDDGNAETHTHSHTHTHIYPYTHTDFSPCTHVFDHTNVLTTITPTITSHLTPTPHACIQFIHTYTIIDTLTLLPFEYEGVMAEVLGGCTLTY
ncbi:hypothetical protein EON65_33480, partial [archaeon]